MMSDLCLNMFAFFQPLAMRALKNSRHLADLSAE